jgi:hypothetical protein
LSSNSPIEKNYRGFKVSPVIVAGGLTNLVILNVAAQYSTRNQEKKHPLDLLDPLGIS